MWLVAGRSAYQRLSTVRRHYYVIGLLQPSYVMPNLVAIRLQEKKKSGKKTPQITVKYVRITQKAHFIL